MDFFKSLNEVRKNNKNFDKWEQQKHDEIARRNELANIKPHTEEELKQAEDYGKAIIKVIDVMDNHSESVAENVETATEPLVGIAPATGTFLASWLIGKHVIAPQTAYISNTLDNILSEENTRKLNNEIEEYFSKNKIKKNFLTQMYNKEIITSKKEIEKIKDTELRKRAEEVFNKYSKAIKGAKTKNKLGLIGIGAAFLGSFIGSQLWATSLQVKSSKIARFQAREALEDPKNFAIYTPEQIAAAEEELKAHPELLKVKEKKKLHQGFWRSLFGIIKDHRAYKKALENDTDESKLVQRELTPQEIEQAQRDKDVIQRTVRIINNEAEKYSENMETASQVLINGTPWLGAAVGAGVGWLIKITGAFKKITNKFVEKKTSENTKALYQEFLKNNDGKKWSAKTFNSWSKFQASVMEDAKLAIENNADKGAKSGKEIFNNLLKKTEYFVKGALAHPVGGSALISGVTFAVTGLAGLILGLKLQKSAARAGRFTAKRELEKNPENFIGYTDEEYNSVSDIKNPQKKTSKLKEYGLFIPRVIKQYFAYSKYKKHEFKHNQELNKILKKQDISEKQMTDAKNLQRKLFNTFEKVDDNSQLYSESMEAATEMAQPFIMYGALGVLITPFVLIAAGIAKGKISFSKVVDKVTKMLSKSSKITKSKLFKKYTKEVEQQISSEVTKSTVNSRPIGAILNGTDLQNDSILKLVNKIAENIKSTPEKLHDLNPYEINNKIAKLRQLVKKYTVGGNNIIITEELGMLDKSLKDAGIKLSPETANIIDKVLRELEYAEHNTRVDLLDILLNPSKIKDMPKERFDNAISLVKNSLREVNKATGGKFEGFGEILNNPDLQESLANTIKAKEAAVQEVKNSIKKVETKLKEFVNGDFDKEIENIINKYNGKTLAEIPEINEILDPILKELPEAERETILSLLNSKTISAEEIEGIKNKAKEILPKIKDKINNIKEIKISDIIKIAKENGIVKNINIEQVVSDFEIKIKNMSEEEFASTLKNMPSIIRSLDKETVEKVLPRIKEIVNNIPKEEINNIKNTLIKEFNEHPDEFIQMLKNGKIINVFNTPTIKKIVIGAGISWTTFTIVMTYVVEAWFADMQLKAGRLGVMKALESLDDNRYYANIEPVQV